MISFTNPLRVFRPCLISLLHSNYLMHRLNTLVLYALT